MSEQGPGVTARTIQYCFFSFHTLSERFGSDTAGFFGVDVLRQRLFGAYSLLFSASRWGVELQMALSRGLELKYRRDFTYRMTLVRWIVLHHDRLEAIKRHLKRRICCTTW